MCEVEIIEFPVKHVCTSNNSPAVSVVSFYSESTRHYIGKPHLERWRSRFRLSYLDVAGAEILRCRARQISSCFCGIRCINML